MLVTVPPTAQVAKPADLPFSALSDERYIYIIRPSVHGTLYFDRFILLQVPVPQEDGNQARRDAGSSRPTRFQLDRIWESRFRVSEKKDTAADNSDVVGYTDMIQTNGFLYLLADSAIDYISAITQAAGSPPTVTVQRQNANPEIGTPWPECTATFGQAIVLGNPSGIYLTSGGAVDKISDMLDGIYNTVPSFSGVASPSIGKAIIFGRRVVNSIQFSGIK